MDIHFGRCTICGGGEGGDDQPNGLPLELYEGKWVCHVCFDVLTNRDASLLEAKKHRRKDKFLSRIGARRTVAS